MNEIGYDKLKKSLDRLVDKYADYQEMEQRPELRESDKESIKESLIQRFETCYDTLWKHLKKHLSTQGLIDLPNSPIPIFRLAHKDFIITNLGDWIDRHSSYTKTRTDTAHDYSREKAENALPKISEFIVDVKEICQRLTEE